MPADLSLTNPGDIPLILLAFVLGLIFGSFATVVSWRVPRNEGIGGRSRCPHCGNQISAVENVPVVSWLFLRGRCRKCGHAISVRYPLIELASGLLAASAAIRFGLRAEAIVFGFAFWTMLVLAVIDLDHKLLPDKIVFPSLLVGAVAVALLEFRTDAAVEWSMTVILGAVLTAALFVFMEPWQGMRKPLPATPEEDPGEADADIVGDEDKKNDKAPFWQVLVVGLVSLVAVVSVIVMALLNGPYAGGGGALVGAAIFSGFLFVAGALWGGRGMGGGDIKLGLLLGGLLGYLRAPDLVLVALFASFLLGGVIGVTAGLISGAGRKMEIPFGPFLMAGTLTAIYWGDSLIDWYSSLA